MIMTREEAKKLLPIIQAFAEGRTIQYRIKDNKSAKWNDVDKNYHTFSPHSFMYRIKPEPKYRPFKDAEECWAEMLKHQPFGYTYDRFNDIRDSITKVATTGVSYDSPTVISFAEIFDRFVFADGVPFGMKVE